MTTDDEFNGHRWHDNAIHGFSIVQGDDGCSGDLRLDIDFISEWLCPADSQTTFAFRIVPSDLVFHDVTNLKISIDYDTARISLIPSSIHEIHRTPITYPNGFESFKWNIELNCPPNSFISFEGSGFTQKPRKEPILSTSQSLSPDQRLIEPNTCP